MLEEPYDIGPIRPPSEARSLLIRVNRNCPWNRCEFCCVYKGRKFGKKLVEEVKGDIDKAAQYYGNLFHSIKRAFLQDADAMIMKTSDLLDVIKYLKEKFPSVDRITTYARTATLARKTVEELTQLGDVGLSRIHTGLESGYGPLLEYVKKGVTPQQQIEAGRKVNASGISLCEYIMPGLGGRSMSCKHAIETARVLNAINPDFIRIRTTTIPPGTPLYKKLENGEFEPLTDKEIVEELRLLIENLEGITSSLVSDHILNLLQEVKGTFPKDKQRMLDVIDKFLALPEEEKILFQVGVRLGIMRNVSHLSDPVMRLQAKEMLSRIRAKCRARDDGPTVEDFIRQVLPGFI
jgi:radical SAM superfamily enzyme YgiQ (UPF0313 family)